MIRRLALAGFLGLALSCSASAQLQAQNFANVNVPPGRRGAGLSFLTTGISAPNLLRSSNDFTTGFWVVNSGATLTANYDTCSDGGSAARFQISSGYPGVQQMATNSSPSTQSIYVRTTPGSTTTIMHFYALGTAYDVPVGATWSRVSAPAEPTAYQSFNFYGAPGTDVEICDAQINEGALAPYQATQ